MDRPTTEEKEQPSFARGSLALLCFVLALALLPIVSDVLNGARIGGEASVGLVVALSTVRPIVRGALELSRRRDNDREHQ